MSKTVKDSGFSRFRNDDELFTLKRVEELCGLSRTTIIRLEKEGFLMPRKVNDKTGYRYYDCANIAQIGQYRKLRDAGLSQHEIFDYYAGRLDHDDFLESLRNRSRVANLALDEFEARFSNRGSLEFSMRTLPECTCYCAPCPVMSVGEQDEFTYDALSDALRRGFKLDPHVPVFMTVDEGEPYGVFLESDDFKVWLCMPIIEDESPDSEHICRFDADEAFTLQYHGNDSDVFERAPKMLWDELVNRGLEPTGPLRDYGIVAPYVGRNFEPEDYVHRFAFPVRQLA